MHLYGNFGHSFCICSIFFIVDLNLFQRINWQRSNIEPIALKFNKTNKFLRTKTKRKKKGHKIIISLVTNKIVLKFIAFNFLVAANFFPLSFWYYRLALYHASMSLFPIWWLLRNLGSCVCALFLFQLILVRVEMLNGICYDKQKLWTGIFG